MEGVTEKLCVKLVIYIKFSHKKKRTVKTCNVTAASCCVILLASLAGHLHIQWIKSGNQAQTSHNLS